MPKSVFVCLYAGARLMAEHYRVDPFKQHGEIRSLWGACALLRWGFKQRLLQYIKRGKPEPGCLSLAILTGEPISA